MKFVADTLKTKVLDTILSNVRPQKERRIGVEIETIFYDKTLGRLPVSSGNRFSSYDLMEGLLLFQKNKKNPCTYSLEPGGQLEWASSPFVSLHDISSQWDDHINQLEKLCCDNKTFPIDFAIDPLYSPEEIKLINMKKYHFMNEAFRSAGTHGQWMMRNSTSVQINIDMVSKRDGENMAFIADCLQPFCSFLFSHVPFKQKGCVKNKNYRLHVWNNTDMSRCGHLFDHGINQNNNLIESFINYLLGVPSLFIFNKESKITKHEGSLGKWLQVLNKKNKLTSEHIQLALHQVFTHVRFKNVLEVRGADRPPFGYELAPAAFWCGLLTTEGVQGKLLKMVSGWSKRERLSLSRAAETLDISRAGPEGLPFGAWLKTVSGLALQGLDERAALFKIASERKFLEPFLDKTLEKPWTLRVQSSLKEHGGGLINYLQKKYIK
jgi:glutamate--cysteine ligase|tara:strand:+ start:8759 stop:10069 length:1311 start_codon:yes stop_codon:yes gene_type:complete